MMLVTPVNHPLTIVRAREIMNWSESSEYKDILDGRYVRVRNSEGSGPNPSRNGASRSGTSATPPMSESGLIKCPHCGREQRNRRFCSLCGGAIS